MASKEKPMEKQKQKTTISVVDAKEPPLDLSGRKKKKNTCFEFCSRGVKPLIM